MREPCETILSVAPDAGVSFPYKMPSFSTPAGGLSIGNQKNYVCVYFCGPELIQNIRDKHPDLDCGVGCVRIRDTQTLPLRELKVSARKALGSS